MKVVRLTRLKGTLRTIKSDTTLPDLTPLDIARQFRHIHLYDILAPVIRHPLPSKTILKLEESLHNVIQTECKLNAEGVEVRYLHLIVATNH
jgi:hypothetical protein